MRTGRLVVVCLICAALTGCQALEQFLNPTPEQHVSRVALDSLPKPDPAKKKVVTVYEFKNKTGDLKRLTVTNGMTEMLISALVKTGHFRVVDRAALDQILAEKQLQSTGMATGDAGKKKLIGAGYIFAGAVTELSEKDSAGLNVSRTVNLGFKTVTARVAVDLRVTDAATGEILAAIPVAKTVRKTGMNAGYKGVGGNTTISNALDLAIRETLDQAVFEVVKQFGAK